MSEIRTIPYLPNFGVTSEGKLVTNIYGEGWEEIPVKLDSSDTPVAYFCCTEWDIIFNVPRTVADAWSIPPSDRIIHLDRNKLNNAPSNLKGVTVKEFYNWCHGAGRVSEATKAKILKFKELGMNVQQIAAALNKSEELITKVLGG